MRRGVGWLIGVAFLVSFSPAQAEPISVRLDQIDDPILSATFTGDFAAFVANRRVFGVEVNSVMLKKEGFPVLDLSDAFFGTADWPDPPKINMGLLETGLVSVPIPDWFFPALASGGFEFWYLFTHTGFGFFAIDFLAIDIVTANGAITAFLWDINDGFKIGIPDNGTLPSPLPNSIPVGATGTGFDEAILGKGIHGVIPEPASVLLLTSGLGLLGLRWKRNRGR